jgi:hypothetical protein
MMDSGREPKLQKRTNHKSLPAGHDYIGSHPNGRLTGSYPETGFWEVLGGTETVPKVFVTGWRVTSNGSNLGPFAAELGTKPCTTTQNKAKRTNQIDILSRLCKQGVTGSIPVTSTNFFRSFRALTLDYISQ